MVDFTSTQVGDKVTIFPAYSGNRLEIYKVKSVGKMFLTLTDRMATKINITTGRIAGENGYSRRRAALTTPEHYDMIERHDLLTWLGRLPVDKLALSTLRAMRRAYDIELTEANDGSETPGG